MRRLGGVLMALLSLGVLAVAQQVKTATAQDYVANLGGEARIVAAGAFVLGGVPLYCGKRATVIDDNLGDYGAAYPGFMNTRRLAQLPRAVKLWIYAHECGHQFRGPDEENRGLLWRAARAQPAVANNKGRGGHLPVHLCRQGRQCAFFRPAPVRGNALVFSRGRGSIGREPVSTRLRPRKKQREKSAAIPLEICLTGTLLQQVAAILGHARALASGNVH